MTIRFLRCSGRPAMLTKATESNGSFVAVFELQTPGYFPDTEGRKKLAGSSAIGSLRWPVLRWARMWAHL